MSSRAHFISNYSAQNGPNPTGSPHKALGTWFTCLLEVCPSLTGGSLRTSILSRWPPYLPLSTERTKTQGLHQRALHSGSRGTSRRGGGPGRGRNDLGKCEDREWSPECKSQRWQKGVKGPRPAESGLPRASTEGS